MYSVIPCAEKHESREEDFSILEAPEARVTLQCAYEDRYALVTDLLLNRRPWPYYIAPFMPLATSCSISNIPTNYSLFDASGQTMNYLMSEVTVTYTSKFQDLYSEELEHTSEFEKLDPKNFKWQSGNLLSEETEVGFLRRGVTLSKTWYDVLDPLPTFLLNYMNCVNADTCVSSTGFVFTPETLLFTPPHLSRTVRFDSTNAWQVNVKMVYKKPLPSDDPSPGWNTFWNSGKMKHERMIALSGAFGEGSSEQEYVQYQLQPFNGFVF